MRWRRQTWKVLKRVLRTAAVTYVVVILLFSMLQTKLIFIGAATQGSADAVVTPPPESELLQLKAKDGTRIVALFGKYRRPDGEREASNTRPTVIFFYGNAMCLKDAVSEFQMFRRLGANVMAVEYAGFGMSGGHPGEQGCYAAAEAAYEHLIGREDIDTHKLVAAGWSLGGAVAIDMARRHAGAGHLCGVMTFSTFTSVTDVGRIHYPMLPVSTLLKHRFESEEKVGGIGVPILIGHGRRDDMAPFTMADRLAAAAAKGGANVTRLTLEDGGHNDFFIAEEEKLERAVEGFLKRF